MSIKKILEIIDFYTLTEIIIKNNIINKMCNHYINPKCTSNNPVKI